MLAVACRRRPAGLPASAAAVPYTGAGVDDPEMEVKVKRHGAEIELSYTDVLTTCSGGQQQRQGGAIHADMLDGRNRFRDTVEEGGVTSKVRGRVGPHRAKGTIRYVLEYGDGACESGEVKWKATRRQHADRASAAAVW